MANKMERLRAEQVSIPEEDKIAKPLMSTGDVAKELQVSSRTISRLIKAGELKAVKSGDLFVITREDFDEFIRNKTINKLHEE